MNIRKEFPSIDIQEFENYCQIEDEQFSEFCKQHGIQKTAHGCSTQTDRQ